MITVKNSSTDTIKVAINHWGTTGDTSYYSINNNSEETWDRSNESGFVMSLVRNNGTEHPFYVMHDDSINVYEDRVEKQSSLEPSKVLNPIV